MSIVKIWYSMYVLELMLLWLGYLVCGYQSIYKIKCKDCLFGMVSNILDKYSYQFPWNVIIGYWRMTEAINEDIFRALANKHRRTIVKVLFVRGPCSYSELMRESGFMMGESGRFAYHLNRLLDTGLVKQLRDGRYMLTRLGDKAYRILKEEEEKSNYDIINALEGITRRIDEDKFFLGGLLLIPALFILIIGVTNLALIIMGIPYRVVVGGQVFYKHPNLPLTIMYLAVGILLLPLSISILRSSSKELSILELLIYQK